MFNVEDILARLQNGEDVDAIAQEMTDALNDANDQFQKEKEEEEKAREYEAKAKELQKLADLQEILDLMRDFCIEYYCENDEDVNTVHAAFATLDAKSVDKMIEEAGAYAVRMAEMQNHFDGLFSGLFGTPTVKKVSKPAPETKTADAVINSFLSSMGLK
jgi:hypothetical protein